MGNSEQIVHKAGGSGLLAGKTAVVTGASRGIGAATAINLAKHGAAVAVNYAGNAQAAGQVVATIEAAGGKALAVQANVGDPAQVEAMAQKVTGALGPVDILVLNATANTKFVVAPFQDYAWEDFEDLVLGELRAIFVPCKVFVPGMAARKQGSIVAVSSGLSRHPGQGFCAHSTGKSGVDALIKSLALELGPLGIRANVVAPGLTRTDATAFIPEQAKEAAAMHTPLRRIADPEDIAGAILMLASDESRFITGAYVPVDGGTTML